MRAFATASRVHLISPSTAHLECLAPLRARIAERETGVRVDLGSGGQEWQPKALGVQRSAPGDEVFGDLFEAEEAAARELFEVREPVATPEVPVRSSIASDPRAVMRNVSTRLRSEEDEAPLIPNRPDGSESGSD